MIRAGNTLAVLVLAAFVSGCAVEGAEVRPSAAVGGHMLHPLLESHGLPDGRPPVLALPEGHPPVGGWRLPEGHPPVPGYGALPEGHPPVCPARVGAEPRPQRPARPAGYEVVRI